MPATIYVGRAGQSGAPIMSIRALLLDGWDETSTWGVDNDMFYAQLTPNGVSDDGGPQVLLAAPQYLIQNVHDLARAIAEATGVSVDDAAAAMRRGSDPQRR